MTTINIVSLTHSEDFDGIGSQAIIHRYFSVLKKLTPKKFGFPADTQVNLTLLQTDYQDYLFYWAAFITGFKLKSSISIDDFESVWISTFLQLHYVDTIEDLEKSYKMVSEASKKRILEGERIWKEIDLLIITDIGYNKVFTSLFPFLEKYSIPFVYFDHHNHDEKTIKFYREHCKDQIIDTKKCATQIVHEYFLPNDAISKHISDIGADTDFSKYELPYSKEIMSVISFYRSEWDQLEEIIKNYSKGLFFTEDLLEKYKSIITWEDAEFDELIDSLLSTKHTFSNENTIYFIIGVSNLRAGRSTNRLEQARKHSELGNKINMDLPEPLIVLTIDRKTLNSNIRSKTLDVHKIAEHFGGGGHTHRAGFRFPQHLVKNSTSNKFVPQDIDLDKLFEAISQVL